MNSTQLKFALFCISFLMVQLWSNSPPVAEGAWIRRALRLMRPTCAGCAGICEVKVPGRCACRTDYNCLRRRGRGKRSAMMDTDADDMEFNQFMPNGGQEDMMMPPSLEEE